MIEFFRKLFSTDFVPHVYCLRSPDVIWLHLSSDLLIAVSYFMIPITLVFIIRKRPDLIYRWLFVMFGLFIIACGTTHLLSVVTLWYPMYRLDGVVKAITALLSVTTAIVLIRLVPYILRIPTRDQLELEINERQAAERALTIANTSLEERVKERTSQLAERERDLLRANEALRKSEISFRRMIESAPNAIAMSNAAGTVEFVNAEMEKTFGYSRDELLGTRIEGLLVGPSCPSHSDSATAVAVAIEPGVRKELCAQHKNGTEFPVEVTVSYLDTEVGSKVLSAIVDITDRRHKERRIESAVKEKDVLLGEIHHRVKNNLQIVHSLLDLQCGQIEDPAVFSMLRDSQNRIRSMALIHQTLYQSNDFGRVDFGIFLNSLVPTLINSYLKNPARIALSILCEDVHLPINAAVPCGLLVNELISNCLKHAFPNEARGRIDISFVIEAEDMATLTVSDDGIGFAEDFNLNETVSLGLQLIFMLTDQLHGKMTVHRASPTSFQLRFSRTTAELTAPA